MENIIVLMILAFLVFSIATALLILETILEGIIEDYSIIIWNFAISIAIVIVVISLVMYRRRKKKKKEEKKKKEVVYLEAEGRGEYRTEYY